MVTTAQIPSPPAAPAAPSSHRGLWVFLIAAVAVLLVMGLAVGYAAWRYTKPYLHDDYLAGYAVGDHMRAEDRAEACGAAASRLYPSTPDNPFPRGSAAFRAGCFDGLEGVKPSGWNMHDRMQMMAD